MLKHQGKTAESVSDDSKNTSQKRSSLSVSYKGAHLLLAEDNDINQQIVIGMLSYLGISVDVVKNGKEAIAALQKNSSYNGILMDLHMPEMDGLEATRIIRKNPQWQDIPIIAMTASTSLTDKALCADVGMNDHIAKPIMPADILAKIAHWIKVKPTSTTQIQPSNQTENRQTETRQKEKKKSVLVSSKKATYWKEIDAISGLKRLELNQPLYHKLLLKFANDYQDIRSTLENSLAQSSSKEASPKESFLQEASLLMHAIKGVAANLGIIKVQELAAELEQAYKDGVLKDLTKLDTQLKKVCHEIHNNLDVLHTDTLHTTETINAKELTMSAELLQDLTHLKKLLEEYDSEAKQALKHILETYGKNTELKSAFDALEEYRFDHAYQLVNNLEKSIS